MHLLEGDQHVLLVRSHLPVLQEKISQVSSWLCYWYFFILLIGIQECGWTEASVTTCGTVAGMYQSRVCLDNGRAAMLHHSQLKDRQEVFPKLNVIGSGAALPWPLQSSCRGLAGPFCCSQPVIAVSVLLHSASRPCARSFCFHQFAGAICSVNCLHQTRIEESTPSEGNGIAA